MSLEQGAKGLRGLRITFTTSYRSKASRRSGQSERYQHLYESAVSCIFIRLFSHIFLPLKAALVFGKSRYLLYLLVELHLF